ncbi:MAG: SDR family oxidoreductase [Rhizobiales bacterium]|nr:SDR family oxidoreductase [Hyphomicrobiales bacterium]MBO6700209.1 SDR family oxidoreductase [Hyphomicrobiales bacterium]MBO6737626.1 SDR family oxidoreductase [Hyphomicrobiales bacterium]MBO6913317.1 SDR family oxidoreductase [Hyphomicrobiales bacterium]MBO6955887.1 SDR family oxidoreductase [Hyphomicrobiales bacterium]
MAVSFALERKTAIVTGGAQGIGLSIAERFVEEGMKVIIADIDDSAGHDAADRLSKIGEALYVHCDVADRLDVRNLLAKSLEAYGEIDVLVANAGIVHTADFLDVEEADFDRVIGVNLKGVFLTCQAVAKHMVERVEAGEKPGTIITMSSVNAELAIPNQVPYVASKGGVKQLTKVMALSLAKHGIRVNAIGPGTIMTEMVEKVLADADIRDRMMTRTPLGRIGEASEIASIAAFLASDQASYVTGQTLYVDGGRLGLNYTVPVEPST